MANVPYLIFFVFPCGHNINIETYKGGLHNATLVGKQYPQWQYRGNIHHFANIWSSGGEIKNPLKSVNKAMDKGTCWFSPFQ